MGYGRFNNFSGYSRVGYGRFVNFRSYGCVAYSRRFLGYGILIVFIEESTATFHACVVTVQQALMRLWKPWLKNSELDCVGIDIGLIIERDTVAHGTVFMSSGTMR